MILAEIQRLFPGIELYSAGDPPAHTLFVLGRGLAPPLGAGDELLLIDPPADCSGFALPERTAALWTQPDAESVAAPGVARIQTRPGGVAHIRVADHLLDLYTFAGVTLVHLPALHLLCSGPFGSGETLAQARAVDDPSAALEALRLAARLVREGRVQLLIPAHGALAHGSLAAMERLADDVAGLRPIEKREARSEKPAANGHRR